MKILFFDADGTLVGYDHILHDTIREALAKTHERGNLYVLCTGRPLYGSGDLKELHFDAVIAESGAVVTAEGKILFRKEIGTETVRDILAGAEECRAGIFLHGERNFYANETMKEMLKGHNEKLKKTYPKSFETMRHILEPVSVKQYRDEPVLKIDLSFSEDTDRIPAISSELSVSYSFSMERKVSGMEISAEGVSKKSGVETVLARYGLNKEDAYCFGDSMNDAGMFEACGHACAMGNASEDLKAMADLVTDGIAEDGLVKAMSFWNLV